MTASEREQVTVLEPQGELYEGAECDEMERTLRALSERGARVVVDVSAAHHLSARCLGILAHARRRCSERGGSIVLCGASAEHRWLLAKTGLADVLPVLADRPAAIRELHERAVA